MCGTGPFCPSDLIILSVLADLVHNLYAHSATSRAGVTTYNLKLLSSAAAAKRGINLQHCQMLWALIYEVKQQLG